MSHVTCHVIRCACHVTCVCLQCIVEGGCCVEVNLMTSLGFSSGLTLMWCDHPPIITMELMDLHVHVQKIVIY